MRKSYAYLAFLLCCLQGPITVGQQWYTYTPSAHFDINAVSVLSPGHIVTGGGQEAADSVQIMLLTRDFGITWSENPHDGFASWNKSMAFSDTLNGYGVGYQGRIIKTNDGGQNWGNSVFPINRSLNKIVNVSSVGYYVVGGRQANDSLQTILKTTNAGSSWNVIYDTAGPWLKSVAFITPFKGCAVGDSGTILYTTNGGTLWTRVTPPLVRDFNAIAFSNGDTGYIAGGSAYGNRQTILRTVNAGASWTLLSDITGPMLNDISFADAQVGYIVGDSATVLKTTDRGLSWLPENIGNNLTGAETFNAVKFYNRNFGAIAGKGPFLSEVRVYTGWPLDVFTLGAVLQDSTTADLYASVNTHSQPGSVRFTYSTDSTFATSFSTVPLQLSSDTFFPGYKRITGLIPNKWYYYFANSGTNSGDTLRFYTGKLTLVFKTLPGDIVDSTTLRFKGDIHGIPVATNIEFEYGSTPNLGSLLAALPATVSDTADHAVTALLTGANQFTIYYYRLRAQVGGNTVYGDIYFTGNPFRALRTLPASYVGDTSAAFNGYEKGFHAPVALSFEYGVAQGTVSETLPISFTSGDSIGIFYGVANGLQPRSIYYYRIKAQSALGNTYGKYMGFYTGKQDSVIQTLAAKDVGSDGATLQGMVNHFPVSVSLSFEYGTDSNMINNIAAAQSTVNDTLYHQASAVLAGVPANTTYYYRLKAVAANGGEMYGDIHAVYIGDNEIPNWDFQNWSQISRKLPAGWNFYSQNFTQVQGHSGNYALNLSGMNVGVMGFPWDNSPGLSFRGGTPYSARPDSVSFYMKGSILGNTATVIVSLRKGSTSVSQNIMTFTVTPGAAFQRVSLPLSYQSGLMPDTLVIGFATVEPGSSVQPGVENNTLTIDDISFSPSANAVYNGDFETWFTHSYEIPDSWFTGVFFGVDSGFSFRPSVVKGNFNTATDFTAEIQNDIVPGIGLMRGRVGVTQAGLFSGDQPSFAIHRRPMVLNGYYKAFPDKGDSVGIMTTLYYHGVAFGYGNWYTTDTAAEYTPFGVPVFYINDSIGVGVIPDSADIQAFSTSAGAHEARGKSKLYIDKLRYDGLPLGIEESYVARFDENGLKVYPNPSTNLMTLEISEVAATESWIQVYNLSGQKQKELKMPAGTEKISFSVGDMEAGFYLLRWTNGAKVVTKKIIVAK